LNESELIEQALPRELGYTEEYPNFVKPLPWEKPMNVKALYTIKKGDILKVRMQKEMPWRV